MTMTLKQAADALVAGQVSARSLTEQALTAAQDPQGEGARVFLRLWPEPARQAAIQADERRRQGQSRGPLDGLPVSVKALFDVVGESTSGGSRCLAEAVPAPPWLRACVRPERCLSAAPI